MAGKNDIFDSISYDGGYAIFAYYGFNPSTQAQKTNPFREERTSSFYITRKNSGQYFFKDFGDDNIKGKALKFIMLYENCDYKTAIDKARKIYNKSLENVDYTSKSFQDKKPLDKDKNISKTCLHSITFKDFTPAELDFWWEKGEIDLQTLQDNKVKSVQAFSFEKRGKTRQAQNLSFVFAYEIVPNKVYKLYMPKRAYRPYIWRDLKTVFLPNLDLAKEKFGENYTYTFGFDNLDKDKNMILCAGEPDCLALKAKGHNAFTFGHERASLPQDFEIDTKKLALLYDTDFTGISQAKKFSKTHKVPFIELPKLEKQIKKSDPKPQANDVCDYVQLFGFDEDLQKNIYAQHYLNKGALKGFGQYITNKHFENPELFKVLDMNKKIILEAIAGSGKTEMIIHYAQKMQKRLILVLPYTVLTSQAKQRFEQNKIICIDGNSKAEDILEAEESHLVAVTYNSLNKITSSFDYKNDLLCVDEFHNLVLQYNFRQSENQFIYEEMQKFEQVVLMSATPLTLFEELDYKTIKVETKRQKQIKIHSIKTRPELNNMQVAYDLISTTPENQITVLRWDNIDKLKALKTLLIQKNLAKAEDIFLLYADDFIEQDEVYLKMIAEEKIPENIKFLFCTSKITDGLNIKNTNIYRSISIGEQWHHLEYQFLERFRKINVLNHFSVKAEKKRIYQVNLLESFSQIQNYAQEEKRILEALDNLEKLTDKNEHKYNLLQQKTTFHLNSKYLKFDHEFNFLQASSEVYQKEKNALNLEKYYQNIQSFGGDSIEIIKDCEDFFTCNFDIKQESQNIQNQNQSEREKATIKIYEMLKKDYKFFFELLLHLTKNQNLRKRIIQYFGFEPKVKSVEVILFFEQNKDFFKTWNKLILKIASKYLFVLECFGQIDSKEIIQHIQTCPNFSRWKNQLTILSQEYLLKAKYKGFDKRLKRDLERLKSDRELLESEDKLTKTQILKLLNQNRYFKASHFHSQNIGEYLKTIFPNLKTWREENQRGTKTTYFSNFEEINLFDLDFVKNYKNQFKTHLTDLCDFKTQKTALNISKIKKKTKSLPTDKNFNSKEYQKNQSADLGVIITY